MVTGGIHLTSVIFFYLFCANNIAAIWQIVITKQKPTRYDKYRERQDNNRVRPS